MLTSWPAAWRRGGGDGGWRRRRLRGGAGSIASTFYTLNRPTRHDYNYHNHVTKGMARQRTLRSTELRTADGWTAESLHPCIVITLEAGKMEKCHELNLQ